MSGQTDIIAAARRKALNKVPAKPTTSMRSQLENATIVSFTESNANKKRIQQSKRSTKQEFNTNNIPDLGEDEALNDRMAQARAMQSDIARENALRNKKVPSQYHDAIMMRRHPVALKRDEEEDDDDASNLSDWEDDVSEEKVKSNVQPEESDNEDLDGLELDSDKENEFAVEEFETQDNDEDVEDKALSDTDSKSSKSSKKKKDKDKKKKDKKEKKLKKSGSEIEDEEDLDLGELEL